MRQAVVYLIYHVSYDNLISYDQKPFYHNEILSNVETGAALATQLKIKVCPTRKLDKVSAVVQIDRTSALEAYYIVTSQASKLSISGPLLHVAHTGPLKSP